MSAKITGLRYAVLVPGPTRENSVAVSYATGKPYIVIRASDIARSWEQMLDSEFSAIVELVMQII